MLQGFDPRGRADVLGLLDAAIARIWELLGPTTAASRDAMSIADVIEIVATSLRGCLVDGIIGSPQGFEPLDAFDFRAWLRRHGASERCVESAFVRGMYSLMFAYEDGDANRPRLSAGVFLRVCARMFFTYRGALFWRMTAGMGEIVFAPLYQLLCERGVRFEFFHRLERVRLTDGVGQATSRVESLDLCVQAETRDGSAYQPLVDVRGLPCWPNEPLWDQLATDTRRGNEVPDYEAIWCRREAGRRTLLAGRDFDFVVIAIGLGGIPHCCSELMKRHESWRRMVEQVKTVATQALQVWARPTLPDLGWNRGPIMITGFHAPFDSWGDMSTLIDAESWPADRRPGTLAYFCNVLPDIGSAHDWCREDHAEHIRAIVRDNAIALLDHGMAPLWPGSAGTDGRFRWDELVAPPGTPHDGIDSQYYRANCNPSDRYVLSLPGTGAARISPLDRDCDNLTVAGDWTACGVDVGCIEAAVMSGMLAAHALTGSHPRTDDIVGYHHP
jgi:uncharacterized protein with NAD-binding domain and iron-sulfur cluster